jgi:hypothetical protein
MSLDAHLQEVERLERDCTQCGYGTTFLIKSGKRGNRSLFCPGCNVTTANPYVEYLRQFKPTADNDEPAVENGDELEESER